MNSPCLHENCGKSAVKGLASGLGYGAKVRFTHSIVISALFGKGNLKKRVLQIIKNTTEHSKNLGVYVFIYKSLLCFITKIRGKAAPGNSAMSGLISSYFIFSKETPVNSQITLYLFSRILTGSTKLLYARKIIPAMPWLEKWSFALLTIFCWASVMYLFEKDKTCLQSSLASSMDFLYVDSEKWKGVVDFIPFGESLQTYFGKLGLIKF
ncbi:unnamed protein product [Blepharisma stoltei]|uniref:Peroxisomal membrane protein 4 n=1 Tax=Blepharisma stoltei TaxID=1481888 RepID=A0AAU9JC00_9CILI|nr:unnamed protein product [Blepharisma stoltei]